eukprot:UN31639
MWLQPCHMRDNVTKGPVDLVFIMDGSGSMKEHEWSLSKTAAKEWINIFESEVPSLQVGLIEFSDAGHTRHQLSSNLTHVRHSLHNLHKTDGTTNYASALYTFWEMVHKRRQNNSYVLGVLLTDGIPSKSQVAQTWNVVNLVKRSNMTIMVSLVANLNHGEFAFNVSSCDTYTYQAKDDCTFYAESDSWEGFFDRVQFLAHDVVATVHDITQSECAPVAWWWFLLLILPVLLSLCCFCGW